MKQTKNVTGELLDFVNKEFLIFCGVTVFMFFLLLIMVILK